MMRIKKNVLIFGIRPEINVALQVAHSVYNSYGYELTITSGTEGPHSRGSLHFQGLAVDLRTRNVETRMHQALRDEIADRLTSEFDVVLEDDHIHIEYQRKS